MPFDLVLTPHGELRLKEKENSACEISTALVEKLTVAFADSTAAGLIALATRHSTLSLPVELSWWREFACECITAQCHASLSESAAPPSLSELEKKAFTAPPMLGIEYLNAACLAKFWTENWQGDYF